MVSFQCHSCGDTIKKPKLDQHRSRCQSGFDCIDCSTTFNTPADYKGHTSCISEAEKYQKGLYKGPKSANGQRNSNLDQSQPTRQPAQPTEIIDSRKSNAQWSRTSQPTSLDNVNGFPSDQQYSHSAANRGAYGRWERQRYPSLSGANGVPLRNLRRSPPEVQPSAAVEIQSSDNAVASVAVHSASTRAIEEARIHPQVNGSKGKDKKLKRKSKLKPDEGEQLVEDANKKGEVEEKPTEAKNEGDTASHGADTAQLAEEGDKEQKKRKRKDKKMQKGSSEEVASKKTETLGDAGISLTATTGKKRVRKKKRLNENEATNEGEVEPPAGEVETPIEEVKLKKKERKRRKKHENDGAALKQTEATPVADTDTGAANDEKKRKRLENEEQLNKTEPTGEEQKAKKRKRKASRDAPADQELNGEEEKKTNEENDGAEVKLTVDGIEKKKKRRKKEKTR